MTADLKLLFVETSMITLTSDEVVLIKTILTALRGIKVRDIDRALLTLSKNDSSRRSASETPETTEEV
ncbi:hypothetical protein XM38_012850 [Halomicronema hongdechloris C2206]|uniref:Uncharacterized protein n=2 Tax=Halomicronema hongdechloris TaxID=1209493 RepID=A0A1Z3HJS3_9CYAN|nr:hypothetical protein XM38_012850 [Halomicronema hongdechloris C2206]